MRDADVKALGERLNELAEVYGKPLPSNAALRLWFAALKPFALADALGELDDWAGGNARMPVPADIRRRLDERRAEAMEQRAREQARERAPKLLATDPQSPVARHELIAIWTLLGKPRRVAALGGDATGVREAGRARGFGTFVQVCGVDIDPRAWIGRALARHDAPHAVTQMAREAAAQPGARSALDDEEAREEAFYRDKDRGLVDA